MAGCASITEVAASGMDSMAALTRPANPADIENTCRARSQISITTPCKVAGGRRHLTKQFDTSGKSGALFDYSEIV
jgi:hypothetical protein